MLKKRLGRFSFLLFIILIGCAKTDRPDLRIKANGESSRVPQYQMASIGFGSGELARSRRLTSAISLWQFFADENGNVDSHVEGSTQEVWHQTFEIKFGESETTAAQLQAVFGTETFRMAEFGICNPGQSTFVFNQVIFQVYYKCDGETSDRYKVILRVFPILTSAVREILVSHFAFAIEKRQGQYVIAKAVAANVRDFNRPSPTVDVDAVYAEIVRSQAQSVEPQ